MMLSHTSRRINFAGWYSHQRMYLLSPCFCIHHSEIGLLDDHLGKWVNSGQCGVTNWLLFSFFGYSSLPSNGSRLCGKFFNANRPRVIIIMQTWRQSRPICKRKPSNKTRVMLSWRRIEIVIHRYFLLNYFSLSFKCKKDDSRDDKKNKFPVRCAASENSESKSYLPWCAYLQWNRDARGV